MTLTRVYWPDISARDLHLVTGLAGPQLNRVMGAVDSAGNTHFLTDVANTHVEFSSPFAGFPAAHGVTVDRNTGQVTVAALPAGRKLSSFLLTAHVTENGIPLPDIRIRIHVHGSVDHIWLSPRQLTVRNGSTLSRLSVLARFDDGVIGDITNWAPFTPPTAARGVTYVHADGVPDTPALHWTAEIVVPQIATPVTVHPSTGALTGTADAGSSLIRVAFDGNDDSVLAVCGPSWSTEVRVERVTGYAAGPGIGAIDAAPNILFLPEGFQAGEKDAFLKVVRSVIKRLAFSEHTEPFASMTGRINYWTAFVPSPDPGVSVLTEVSRHTQPGGEVRGLTVAGPSLPDPPNLGPWELPDVINKIGLPTPVDDPDGSALAPKIPALQSLYGATVTEVLVAPEYPTWLSLNHRVLLNERDSAFHMAIGNRPMAQGTGTDRDVAPNPLRVSQADLTAFLDALRGPSGEDLHHTWTAGKDKGLVVMICRSSIYGGTGANFIGGGGVIGISIGSLTYHVLPAGEVPATGMVPAPDPIPADGGSNLWLTAAHELSHSWGLGDEYGEFDGAPPADEIDAVSHRWANLQPRKTMEDPDGHLLGRNVRWALWPRISAAAVITAAPAEAADQTSATVTVPTPDAAPFKVGDVVRLRRRPLVTAGPPSRPYRIDRIPGGGAFVLTPILTPTIDALHASYPAGSIMLRAVRGDAGPESDLRLVVPAVLDRITVSSNPLNATAADAFNRPCDPRALLPFPTRAINFVGAAPQPPRFSAFTIGVYEYGDRYKCSVYRPTGICLMATKTFGGLEDHCPQAYEFCIVCRYAMVDTADPTRHAQVDAQYVKRYIG